MTTHTQPAQFRPAYVGGFVIVLALILRLAFVMIIDPSPDFKGGDANWYMENGRHLVMTGKTAGPLQTAPLYPVTVGVVQVLVPGGPTEGREYNDAEMQAVRLLQSLLGTALVAFGMAIAWWLYSRRAAWWVGLILAINPALIIQAGSLSSEQVFLFFVFGGMAGVILATDRPTLAAFATMGAFFGFATLTRAVFLLYPFGVALYFILFRRDLQHRLRLAAAMLAIYSALVATWTVYNWIVWDRLVIGGEGLTGFVYQGATAKASPHEIDDQLGVTLQSDEDDRLEAMRNQIKKNILSAPGQWLAHRLEELAKAVLQPHNTVYLKGESIRDAAWRWLRHERSLGGLVDLTHIEAFWPKLAIYLFHFGGLLFGLAGMVEARRRWRAMLPLWGLVVYIIGVHLLLLALPRYLFPMMPVFWVFTGAWLATRGSTTRYTQDHSAAVSTTS